MQSKIEKSIHVAAASLEMEGFKVDADCVELCRLMLEGKISMKEYIKRVTAWEAQRQCQ